MIYTSILSLGLVMMLAITVQAQKQSNRHFSHTLHTNVEPDKVWVVWNNVAQWKVWDEGLKDASAEGPLALGTKGTIVSLNGKKSKFEVVAFEAGKSYTFKTKLPMCGLFVKRSLTTKAGTTCFTHEVWFKGPLSAVFASLLGKKFRAMLPPTMQNIKQSIEAHAIR